MNLTKQFIQHYGTSFKIPMTHCKKCNSKLDLRVTTELTLEEEEKGFTPKVLLLMGLCDKCEIIYMLRAIPIEEIPKINLEDCE